MWTKPTRERMSKIPGLYKTGDIDLHYKLVYLHFYLLNNHWYVIESNGTDTFFGFVILNGDLQNAEWSYFTLWKLQQYNVHGISIECEPEYLWRVKPALHVPKIARAHGWVTGLQRLAIANGGQYV